ncbi:MAG: phospholipase D-like domain-containing protein [Bacteroidia bacterium]|nr:phospholipase D-like domain-containing protein [Bacteroidia bacterium]
MMKNIIGAFFGLFTMPLWSNAQLVTIDVARQMPVGSVITVQGVVTNGQELGNIRYLQDGTAGIAAFGTSVITAIQGDYIEVTGTLYNYFNLLELNPVTSVTILSQGNQLPPAAVVIPSQLDESLEGQLVQINAAVFQSSGIFSGSANYSVTASGQNAIVRISPQTNLNGAPIPTGSVTLTAICSQYQSTYQLLPRDTGDLQNTSVFYVTIPPKAQNITTNGFEVIWQTNLPGNAFAYYGKTPAYELGLLSGNTGTVNAMVSVANAFAAEVFYIRPFSVSVSNDTAFAASRIFITRSESSGRIETYFNRSVNNSVASSSSNLAVSLNNAFADTLAAYIDRSELSLDIAIYNFSSAATGSIVAAINNAFLRGVGIRIIADGNNANNALQNLNPSIPILNSPVGNGYYNIMHNKFMVIDALATDAEKAVVISGSTNWTDMQLNTDANNMVFIRDQSLAKVYTMEFEEMWGSNGPFPNAVNSKFGPDKTDNTPHQVNAGGVEIECYFSPSDEVNNRIMAAMNTADIELYFAALAFTRFDLASAIADRISHHQIYAAGIADDWNNGGQTALSILQNVMGPRVMTYNHSVLPGILHHKYLIVDQSAITSDPLVLTGSHNWSTTANQKNDENTLIIHSASQANQFYQEFSQRFFDNGGGMLSSESEENSLRIVIAPNPSSARVEVRSNVQIKELILYDLTGKRILSENLNTNYAQLITESLEAGIYLLKIETTEKLIIHKLSIIH